MRNEVAPSTLKRSAEAPANSAALDKLPKRAKERSSLNNTTSQVGHDRRPAPSAESHSVQQARKDHQPEINPGFSRDTGLQGSAPQMRAVHDRAAEKAKQAAPLKQPELHVRTVKRPPPRGHSQFLFDSWELDELLDLFTNAESRLGAAPETAEQRAIEAVAALRDYAEASQETASPTLTAWAKRGADLWSDVRHNFRDRRRAAGWIYSEKMDALSDDIFEQSDHENRIDELDIKLSRFGKINRMDETALVVMLRDTVPAVGKFAHEEAVKSAVKGMQNFVRRECELPYSQRSEHCPPQLVSDFCELWIARQTADNGSRRGDERTVSPLAIFSFHKEMSGFVAKLKTREKKMAPQKTTDKKPGEHKHPGERKSGHPQAGRDAGGTEKAVSLAADETQEAQSWGNMLTALRNGS